MKMQREISNRVFLGQTVSPFENAGNSSAIDRMTSNYTDAKEKIQKIKELINTENITRTLPNLSLESLK